MKKNRRKPISFDTTLRNPSRIPQFISILKNYEGKIIDNELALELEAEIISQKIFEPTEKTLGTYIKQSDNKFSFLADDQSKEAPKKVKQIFKEWQSGDPGSVDLGKIIYLLKNTTTFHKERGWKGGWESRIHTQFNFLNELGLVKVIKNKKIAISDNANLMIHEYKNGHPKSEEYDESYEQSAFLNAFSKYQINNPFRSNTIKVNFFPLVLNVIKYVDEKYDRHGISRQDLPFIIAWGNNNYEALGDYIMEFREKFKYNTSSYEVYEYAINLLDDTTSNTTLKKASKEFIEQKKSDYKYEKIMFETPDEVIRKLRLTMLISLKGAGYFIDINKNETDKINHVVSRYVANIDFKKDVDKYFKYMGKIDNKLIFHTNVNETKGEKEAKEKAIEEWANKRDWNYLKDEMIISVEKHPSNDSTLKYVKDSARLEFLSAIVIKKALPGLKVIANYKADDQGIPFNTASGERGNHVGADIDVFENKVHATIEPTLSKQRSIQVEHEIPSIRTHVLKTQKKDKKDEKSYDEWFSLFIASNISRDVGTSVAVTKCITKVEIYPWEIRDFIEFSKSVKSIKDYKIIRDYAKPQRMIE